jgi:hypothetical protein
MGTSEQLPDWHSPGTLTHVKDVQLTDTGGFVAESRQKVGVRRRIPLNFGWVEADELDTVEVGDHLMPRLIDIVFPGADGQPRLEATIDSSSGVPRCTALHLTTGEGGREVRTTDLRAVELESWIEAVVPLYMAEITERHPGGGVSAVIRTADTDADDYKRAKAALRRTRRNDRRKVTPEVLRKVARTYASDPLRPAEAVEVAFDVSTRTAYRYIQLARDGGYLEDKDTGA